MESWGALYFPYKYRPIEVSLILHHLVFGWKFRSSLDELNSKFCFYFIDFFCRFWFWFKSRCWIMDMTHLRMMDPGQLTVLGSAFCTMLTMHFTVQLVSQHLFYWKNPKEQKAIIIIVLMAPIYAMDSFVGLLDIRGSKAFFMFLDSIKECYEALVSSFDSVVLCIAMCLFWHIISPATSYVVFFQVIAKFLALMYSYLNISISKNIVPDGIKGREIRHSFPMTLFQVC